MVLGANLSALIATAGTPIPVIGQQTNSVERSLARREVSAMRRLLYRRLHAFVIPSRRLAEDAESVVPAERVHVIPRHVSHLFETPGDAAASLWDQFPGEHHPVRIVAMGRFVPWKGFDDLFHAITRFPPTTMFNLIVLGEGRDRPRLEGLVADLELGDRLWLPGWADDPRPTLVQSTFFVLPSHWEGWPNSLLQAMALGLPVIASDCPTGPGEIITQGIDGILVGVRDIEGLSSAMQKLIADPDLRRRLGSAAPRVRERFSIERIASMWEELFPAEQARLGHHRFSVRRLKSRDRALRPASAKRSPG
jgi:glycosyltransferase involved in cell wall biosynthesis